MAKEQYYMLYDVFECEQTFVIPEMHDGRIRRIRLHVKPGVKYELKTNDEVFIKGLKSQKKTIPWNKADFDSLVAQGYEDYTTKIESKRFEPIKRECKTCGGRNAKIDFHAFKVVI